MVHICTMKTYWLLNMNTRAKSQPQPTQLPQRSNAQDTQSPITAGQLADLLKNYELLAILQKAVNKIIEGILSGVSEKLLSIEKNAGNILELQSTFEIQKQKVKKLEATVVKQKYHQWHGEWSWGTTAVFSTKQHTAVFSTKQHSTCFWFTWSSKWEHRQTRLWPGSWQAWGSTPAVWYW